ncbi:hypothetical protein NMY22_g12586 [Coprinellus aureogranulatus]|nr:hypothetical protein NMY22_g12586 [Coprinellus aureogranulatus]
MEHTTGNIGGTALLSPTILLGRKTLIKAGNICAVTVDTQTTPPPLHLLSLPYHKTSRPMTITKPPLLVAAHIHSRTPSTSTKGSKENVPVPLDSQHHQTPLIRDNSLRDTFSRTPSTIVPFVSRPHRFAPTKSRKARAKDRARAEQTSSVFRVVTDTPALASSSSDDGREIIAPKERALYPETTTKLASDKVARIQTRTDKLENHVEELESLVKGFKGRVSGLVREFELLKEDLAAFGEEYEALEADHLDTLAALDEETSTSYHYIGKLRNAEVEIHHLYAALPEGIDIGLNSQAKSLSPIYDRYA